MNRRYGLFLLFLLIACAANVHAQPLGKGTVRTVSDELRTLYDVSLLPAYLEHSIAAQTSSYDLTGGNEDGFTGKYSFVRRNPDSSLVIFDMQGPGVITRIWTPTPTEDSLDFFIDNKKVLTIKYDDLFSGRIFPFLSPVCGQALGGNFCYFPILFQKSCRIVYRGKKMQFYQIQYKLYPVGTKVKSFASLLEESEKKTLTKAIDCWNSVPGHISNWETAYSAGLITLQDSVEIMPGESKTIFSGQDGGRILGIVLDAQEGLAGDSKLLDIRINWDDEQNPAVYCPAADFFGFAFGKPSMQSLLLGTRHTRSYCYFPMPFDRKANIQLLLRKGYGKTKPVKLFTTIYYSKEKRNPEREGRFYSYWNRTTPMGQSHVFLNTTGKGHYVGSILQAQGIHPGMTYFFEGDDSTSVDGQMRIHGTGSEDYFNGGWYALPDKWDRKMSLPLHGCLDYSLPYARTGAYRMYMSDKIPFEKSIYQSIEHAPSGNDIMVDYTSLGLYYGEHAPENQIVPENRLTQVDALRDTMILYPQLINFGMQDNFSFTTAWKYNTGGLSYAFTVNDDSGLKIPLSEIPYGRYRLLMDFVQSDSGCSFSIWQGQTRLTEWISGIHAGENPLRDYYLTELENNEFRNSITIRFKTKKDQDHFVLNRLIFVRRTE